MMKMGHFFILLEFVFLIAMCGSDSGEVKPLPPYDLTGKLADTYSKYQEKSISDRRFKHSELVPLINKLGANFEVEKAGKSIEGRDIYLVKTGKGPIKVLLWSQMHGDESTATMALLDIFNFLGQNDEFDALRQQLREQLTIYFIPMLNPDGAERFERRNALGIDLNRDAQRLQCPESQLLKRIRDQTDADWGFNLHDQSRYYAAGSKANTATLSFLAPAYNEQKEINQVRGDAMRLIGWMNTQLQPLIPGKIAKYYDGFEPRAFGDNIQKWGTSTVLIESGGLANDREKQEIRKFNYLALLTAMDAIANRRYAPVSLDAYNKIPFNNGNAFHDLILREVEVEKEGNWYMVDIAFRNNERDMDGNREFYYRSSVSDIGDLSIFYAYEDFPGKGYRAVPGKTYPEVLPNINALKKLDASKLWREGYTSVRLQVVPQGQLYSQYPLQLLSGNGNPETDIISGTNPALLLQKDGQTRFVVVNGFLFDVQEGVKWERY
ncbi:MAG: hypothetical protein DHS20C18_31510 [Saprospiraceae bacterium]|nr:MAG: hypothetical protein DHS20C18_31510 [Saprospiraceae bacterium]